MSDEKKVSDVQATSLAGIALVLGLLYVWVGVDWYSKGHLVMCYCELSVDPRSWCYRPEPGDPPAGAPRYQPSSPSPGNPQSGVNGVIANSLGTINRCYKGTTAALEYENSWSHRFALWWNHFFLDDENRRDALAALVSALYVAFLGFAGSVLKDWWLQPK
jgi:hypothetical protein